MSRFKIQSGRHVRRIGEGNLPTTINDITDVSYVPDKRLGFCPPIASYARTTDRPYGLGDASESYANAVTRFDNEFDRVESFYDTHGYARIVFHSIAGREQGGDHHGDVLGGEAYSMDTPGNKTTPQYTGRRHAFMERLQQYYEYTNFEGTCGIYTASKIGYDPYHLAPSTSTTYYEPYDHTNYRHRKIVDQLMLWMKDLGMTEIFFDNSQPTTAFTRIDGVSTTERAECIKLIRYCREVWNINAYMEGVPRSGNDFLYDIARRTPSGATWKNVKVNGEATDGAWAVEGFIPDDMDANLLMGSLHTTLPTQTDFENYYAAGWNILVFVNHNDSNQSNFDSWLSALLS